MSRNKNLLKKRIKKLKQKFERKEKKIDLLRRIIKKLEKNKIVSNHAAEILDHNFSGLTIALLKSELKNRALKQMGYRYSDEPKKLILTLHFYSTRAYEFVKFTFALPAVSSLSHWTSSAIVRQSFLVTFLHLYLVRPSKIYTCKYCEDLHIQI